MNILDKQLFKSVLNELRQASQPVLALPRYAKCTIALLIDTSLCVLTAWFALYLRLGEFVPLSGKALWAVVLSVALALPVFVISGLYRAIFRHSGYSAMSAVARALGVYTLLYASVITALSIPGIPRTMGLIQPLLLFFCIAGSRVLAYYWLGRIYQSRLTNRALPKALIYGAGGAGRQLVSALDNGGEIKVVGFLDDDTHLHGHVLSGKRIFSPADLSRLIKSRGVTHVLLAIPSASRRRRNAILKNIIDHNHVAVHTLPSFMDLAEGRVTTSELRDLDIDDLLGRDTVAPNRALLSKNIASKVVLVTGAGGSIGAELCRQIIKLKPNKLLLVDISEYALYAISMELNNLVNHIDPPDSTQPKNRLVSLLASVQDRSRIMEIMQTWRPDTVYHAASYKHVPLVEYNLSEGLKNNVIGTLVMAQIAIKQGVSDFVLISTDKAVRPTSVMGASKRLAELCLQALFANKESARLESLPNQSEDGTKLSMVRFGNVLDSSGSVIPRFRQQIRNGGPLTLTHPEITRFFMTIPEAAQLVIQAGAMAEGGDVFVLNMGEPVKIADLARRMIELSGLSVRDNTNLEGDIEIVLTGLRPGEKLYEELMLGDNPQPTAHPKIRRAQDPFIPWSELQIELDTLKAQLDSHQVQSIIETLQRLVAGYQPSDEIVDWVFDARAQTKKATQLNTQRR